MSTAGKTAPKLIDDFLRFDPQNIGSGNYLTAHPAPAGEGKLGVPPANACRHEYLLKAVQSVLPPVDSRPHAGTQYKTALLCSKCLIHADVHISYPHLHATNPCPSVGSPLHHLQYCKDREVVSTQRISYGWRCSIEDCHAEVTISYRRTRISEDNRELLAGADRLQQRYTEASQAEPDRNVKLTTPTAAMNILHRYLKDALDPTVEKRRLMANNKLFIATFGRHGRDCKKLLTDMGFVYYPATDEEEAQWALPNPPLVADRLHADGTSNREMLEDIESEAITWSAKLAFASGELNPTVAARGLPSANSEVQRVLGAQNCLLYDSLAMTRLMSYRRSHARHAQPHPAAKRLSSVCIFSMVINALQTLILPGTSHRSAHCQTSQTACWNLHMIARPSVTQN